MRAANLVTFTIIFTVVISATAVSPAGAQAPSASFSYSPSSPIVDESIRLDASASADEDGEIVRYEWDVDGDGHYTDYNDKTGQSASISFETAGTYTVGLRVEDESGETSTERQTIVVSNDPPSAAFDYTPTSPVADERIQLDASPSADSDGELTEYKWDLDGDGHYTDYNDDTGQTSHVTFDTGGTYTVGLRVTDNGEETDTVTKSIVVGNDAPSADFDYSPSAPVADEKIQLDAASSSDSDGQLTEYKWDLDGDGHYTDYNDDTGQTSQVTFDTAGTYTIGLRVTDNGDVTDTKTQSITVTNDIPTPSFTYLPSDPVAGETIKLDGGNSADQDGNIVKYEWDLDGDGHYTDYNDDTGQTSQITFETAGTYTIGLRVTDNGDESKITTQSISVTNDAPTARFDYTISDDQLSVSLDGGASSDADGQIVKYEWDLDGDGHYTDYNDGTGQTTTATFSESGAYSIGLKVTDNGGESTTTTQTIGVSKSPTAELTVDPRVVAVGEPATFSAAGSVDPDGRIEQYQWTFPNGKQKEGREVTHQFSSPGSYEVSLTVVDSSGATDTITSEIDAEHPPEIDITWTPEIPRDDLDVVFEGTSPDSISTYKWDFDNDGTFDQTGQMVSHAFDETGKQTIRVRAEASSGVATTITRVVAVQQSAGFELTADRSEIQSGDEVIALFTVSNDVNDRPLEAKLEFNLPSEGVSITGVDGADLVSSHATGFFDVPAGDEKTLQVSLQFNDLGEYDVSGNAVYYFGGKNGSSDRRTTEVGPATLTVIETPETSTATAENSVQPTETTETSTPGFGLVIAIIALCVVIGLARRTRDS